MLKIKICFAFLVLVSVKNTAQTDSLQNSFGLEGSREEIISEGRQLLLENFLESDYQKLKEVKDFLKTEVENEDYLSLYDLEHWLILYWTREYDELLSSIENLENDTSQQRITPVEDTLYGYLFVKSRDSRIVLRSFIKNAELEEDEKDFLLMHLEYITTEEDEWDQTQERLNRRADLFLKSYEDSQFRTYTRQNIRYKTVLEKFGFAFGFFSGYGILNYRLGDYFSNNIPIGFTIEGEYEKFRFSLRNYIGVGTTKKEIDNGREIWQEGSSALLYTPQISLGYILLESKRFKIVPYGGIGGTSISPVENDIINQPGLENAGLDFKITYTYGMSVDIKLGKPSDMIAENGIRYMFLRLRYEYASPRFTGHYLGNMHNISIGIGGFTRLKKRLY